MISSCLLLVPATVLAISLPAAAQTSDAGQVEKLSRHVASRSLIRGGRLRPGQGRGQAEIQNHTR